MDRRSLLKAAGVAAASLFAAPARRSAGQGGKSADITENEITSGADARIEKYRKANVTLNLLDKNGKPIPSGSPVSIEQTNHQFLFGCNIFMLNRCKIPDDNAAYAERFAELLNFATLPFYWWAYESERGKADYARTEEILKWCKANNVTPKGHPLAWNFYDPKWLTEDPDEAMQLQLMRIVDCVRRFKGRLDIWDVVNEATHYDRPECLKNAPRLSAAITQMGIGQYVRKCFEAARTANPGATLLINDYRTEPDYAEKVISKITDDARKPLYDVIGIQSHQHGGAWPVKKIWDTCEYFAKFGVPLHFTETTFLSGKQGWELNKDRDFKWQSTPEGEQRQAEDAARFYTLLFSHPAVEAITWWDFSDQGAWQQAPAGLLHADMTPKPAYDVLKHLIKKRWWTKTTDTVAADGTVNLRGFYGDYKISADGPQAVKGDFHLDKSSAGQETIHLN